MNDRIIKDNPPLGNRSDETLRLNPPELFARVRIQNDPIEAIRCWYLAPSDVPTESQFDFERRSPVRLTISDLNVKAEAEDLVAQGEITEPLLQNVIKLMPKPAHSRFTLEIDVNAMNPPDSRLLSDSGDVNGIHQCHFIEFSLGNDGFEAKTDSLSIPQEQYFLNLISNTLSFVLGKAKTGRNYFASMNKAEDAIVADHSFVTATNEDLVRDLGSAKDREKIGTRRDQKVLQLTYLKATIDEVIKKIS